MSYQIDGISKQVAQEYMMFNKPFSDHSGHLTHSTVLIGVLYKNQPY